jgi:ankyrin repeat protein
MIELFPASWLRRLTAEQEAETTPLHYAAAMGDMETLTAYCQPGAHMIWSFVIELDVLVQIDINGRDPQGRTPLVETSILAAYRPRSIPFLLSNMIA